MIGYKFENSLTKVLTKSPRLAAKQCPLRFFMPQSNVALKFSNCWSDKGYEDPSFLWYRPNFQTVVTMSFLFRFEHRQVLCYGFELVWFSCRNPSYIHRTYRLTKQTTNSKEKRIGTNERTCSCVPCQVGDRVGVVRKPDGTVHFFVNGIDQGACATCVPANVYGVIDLYGMAAEATIVDQAGELWSCWSLSD